MYFIQKAFGLRDKVSETTDGAERQVSSSDPEKRTRMQHSLKKPRCVVSRARVEESFWECTCSVRFCLKMAAREKSTFVFYPVKIRFKQIRHLLICIFPEEVVELFYS